MKYEIIRIDINKTVLKAREFADAESAFGLYLCALTVSGIIKSAADYTYDGGDRYTLKNGWKLEVRPVV